MECISRCQSSEHLQRGSNGMHFKQGVQLQGRVGKNALAYYRAKCVCVEMNPFSMFCKKRNNFFICMHSLDLAAPLVQENTLSCTVANWFHLTISNEIIDDLVYLE